MKLHTPQRPHRKTTSPFAMERYKIHAPLPSITMEELDRLARRSYDSRQPQLVWDVRQMIYRWVMA